MPRLDLSSAFPAYRMRPLTPADVPAIHALCAGNPQFYAASGRPLTEAQILSDLTALPPNKTLADKYHIGIFTCADDSAPVAVLDLIVDYPTSGTAFLGFFMLRHDLQNKGIGSAMISDLAAYLQTMGFARIRLGIDKGNVQAEHFWQKNGFRIIDEVPQGDDGTILRAERTL